MYNVRAVPEPPIDGTYLCDLGGYRAYVDHRKTTTLVTVFYIRTGKEARALFVGGDAGFYEYRGWCFEEEDSYLSIFCLAHLLLYGEYPKHTPEKVRDLCTT